MVKKIRLLGMEIDNYPLHEEMMRGEDFMNKSELNIIRTISMKMLSMAADNKAVRDGIEQADLLIIENKEILIEAGIRSSQRLWEASQHEFMQEYIKCMSRGQRRIFLVAADYEGLETFEKYLKSTYENLLIVGSYVLEKCGKDYDIMINEINAITPDAILSVLDFLQEEEFLLEAKAKIDAKVWYSLGEHYYDPEGKTSVLMWIRQLICKGKFKNTIHNYKDYHE